MLDQLNAMNVFYWKIKHLKSFEMSIDYSRQLRKEPSESTTCRAGGGSTAKKLGKIPRDPISFSISLTVEKLMTML